MGVLSSLSDPALALLLPTCTVESGCDAVCNWIDSSAPEGGASFGVGAASSRDSVVTALTIMPDLACAIERLTGEHNASSGPAFGLNFSWGTRPCSNIAGGSNTSAADGQIDIATMEGSILSLDRHAFLTARMYCIPALLLLVEIPFSSCSNALAARALLMAVAQEDCWVLNTSLFSWNNTESCWRTWPPQHLDPAALDS